MHPPLQMQRLRQPKHRMLRRRIPHSVQPRRVCRDGPVVYDTSARRGLGFKDFEGFPRSEEWAGEVYVDGGLPIGEGELVDWEGGVGDACILCEVGLWLVNVRWQGNGVVQVVRGTYVE